MQCPYCYKLIPSFIKNDFLKRKRMCPECWKYCTIKIAEDYERTLNENLRKQAKSDQKERKQ